MSDQQSERLFNKAVGHEQAIKELEAEAAAAGRRLTEGERAYVAELHQEGSLILDTSVRASQQEKERGLGKIVAADTSGTILTDKEITDSQNGAAKASVAGGGRLAD